MRQGVDKMNLLYQNRVSELLHIRYPIIEGGMAHIGDGNLAATVSNEGGFGQIAISGRSPKQVREQIEDAVAKTSKPFGINIPISGFFSSKSNLSSPVIVT